MFSQDQCHRALTKLDVLRLIFEALRSARGYASLANCAVTCLAWKEMALDVLWRETEMIDAINVLGHTGTRFTDEEDTHVSNASTSKPPWKDGLRRQNPLIRT